MNIKTLATNKKAFHDFKILDTLEVGIKLTGPEVKSVRASAVSLKESLILVEKDQLIIKNLHISPYKFAPADIQDPLRDRVLLANKKEITSLKTKTKQKGLSLIPTKVYLKNNRIKLEIALVQGKKKWDKRESIKKKDIEREKKQELL